MSASIPFLVSELRLPPDEQELLQREWWPSTRTPSSIADGVFLFDNGAGFGNAEVESTFTPRVTAIEDALAQPRDLARRRHRRGELPPALRPQRPERPAPDGVPIFVQRAEWAKVHEPDYTVAGVDRCARA